MLLLTLMNKALAAHKAMMGDRKRLKEDSFDDLQHDVKAFSRQCQASLDPVIKMVLQNRGVSVIKNIYVGYDTEYTVDNFEKHLNKTVSYQLALNHLVIVRVPQPYDFTLGEKDAKSGVFRKQPNLKAFDIVIQASINELCKAYREKFLGNNDEFTRRLTEALEKGGFQNYASNNYRVFRSNRSENKELIEYTPKGMVTSEELLEKCLELDDELGPSLGWLKDMVISLGAK